MHKRWYLGHFDDPCRILHVARFTSILFKQVDMDISLTLWYLSFNCVKSATKISIQKSRGLHNCKLGLVVPCTSSSPWVASQLLELDFALATGAPENRQGEISRRRYIVDQQWPVGYIGPILQDNSKTAQHKSNKWWWVVCNHTSNSVFRTAASKYAIDAL